MIACQADEIERAYARGDVDGDFRVGREVVLTVHSDHFLNALLSPLPASPPASVRWVDSNGRTVESQPISSRDL